MDKIEIVKYQNDMNKLSFKGFTQMDMNIFMVLCSKVKEENTSEITLAFSEIKQLVHYEKKNSISGFIADLRRMNQRLMSVNCEIITNAKIIMFVLFPTFEIDSLNETLTVAVNEKFAWLLNEMKNYTTFELNEFISLNSKYAKILYRLLKQWRTQGYYIFHDLSRFRELLDVPKSYTNRQLMQDCVGVAVKEIAKLENSFFNFECEPIYARKRGKPLEALKFTWQCERTLQTSKNIDSGQAFFLKEQQEQTFEDFLKTYKGDDKPSPVELKIAKDIASGRKKQKKTNKFNNFEQRNYNSEELEKILLTTTPPNQRKNGVSKSQSYDLEELEKMLLNEKI